MENESSISSNTNRKRGPIAGSLPATSSSPLASSSSVETNAIVKMPTTPEQLERMISTRVTAALASNDSGNISSGSSVATPFTASATSGYTTSHLVTSPIPTLGIASSPIQFPSIGSTTLSSVPFTLPTPSSPPTSVVIVKDIAKSVYRSTTSMSCDLLKLHKLVQNGGDNKMILTILGGEDLLSMRHDRSRSQRQQTQQDIPAEKMY